MIILASGSLKLVQSLVPQWPGRVGLLLSPRNNNTVASVVRAGLPWAIDNGAYRGLDLDGFRRLVGRACGQPGLLWVVCPDRVADATATLELWREHSPWLRASGVPVAFVLQDGQEDRELPQADCYFVGGSTRWKLSQHAGDLGAEARRRGAWLHCGRVNSLRRLRFAYSMGCDSVDGSAYSRWACKSERRPDMSLARHLAYAAELERSPSLF